MCTGGVYAVGLASSSPVQWVLGATFMKNVYTVFNYGSGGSESLSLFRAMRRRARKDRLLRRVSIS